MTPFENEITGVGVGWSGATVHGDGVAGLPDAQAVVAKIARATAINLYLLNFKFLDCFDIQAHGVKLNLWSTIAVRTPAKMNNDDGVSVGHAKPAPPEFTRYSPACPPHRPVNPR